MESSNFDADPEAKRMPTHVDDGEAKTLIIALVEARFGSNKFNLLPTGSLEAIIRKFDDTYLHIFRDKLYLFGSNIQEKLRRLVQAELKFRKRSS